MTYEYDTILEAKRSLKLHIKFLEQLLDHLKGHNKPLRGRACFAAWCLHRYLNDRFVLEIEEAIKNHTSQEGQGNVQ